MVIESIGLKKNYGKQIAVNEVSFEVNEGECFGILGPNGAGKTSLFKMIYGSSEITDGELFVLGMSAKDHIKQIKQQIGVMPQEDGLDSEFGVLDNLLVYGSYFGYSKSQIIHRVKELLRITHLEDYADRNIDELSGGMKRRLTLARALINEPKLLLLDEPSTGLDPQAREWVWNELKDLNQRGVSMLLTTHYMEEAEELCDRIIIMNEGKVVAKGTPYDLISEYVGKDVVEFEVPEREMDYHIQRVKDKYSYQIRRNCVQIHLPDQSDVKKVLNEIQGESVVVRKASLNDVFLKIAGYELRD